MNKQRMLRLYKAGLRLYPKKFRSAYAEQMYMTAQDLLADTSTRVETARIMGTLGIDLLVTALKENNKQLGGAIKKQVKITSKKSALAAITLALQISGVLIMSYLYLLTILYAFSYAPQAPAPTYLSLITTTAPALLMPIAFFLLRKAAQLSVWSRIVWSYGLGAAGALCYFLFGTLLDSLRQQLYPQLFTYPDSTNALQIYWHDWLIISAFLVLFYLATSHLVAHLASRVPKVLQQQ